MWNTNFWKQSAERAIKSSAQSLVGLWAMDGFNVLHVDLPLAAGVAGGAAVLSLLTSIITSGVGEPGDPSAVHDTP
jgi:hypothetical protein